MHTDTLLACILTPCLHGLAPCQVERIAQTEPQTLRDLTPVSGLLRAVAALIGQVRLWVSHGSGLSHAINRGVKVMKLQRLHMHCVHTCCHMAGATTEA